MSETSKRWPGTGERGFTMVELLIAMAVTATTIGTTLLVALQLQQSYYAQLDGAAVQQEARYALDWITKDLTSAGSNPSTISVSACPQNGTAFTGIRRDPNGDGVQNDIRIHADIAPPNGVLGGVAGACTEAGEDVTIAYDAAAQAITRRDNNTQNAAVPMTDSVISQLSFTYLDANRLPAATDDAVAFVQVTVVAQTPRPDVRTGQPATFTLNSEVRVRSR